ncbi:maleylpyruvate isomerase family mycothiol-dependent enzyme [Glycomyces paridis]|uniref:Maleylpyruvate isomerase family mycothiol-dependent enzyme n=1 Tax=Glycomyces paridis TaxID=2126555 RepID=A0A4S8P988_9ACTN|nr:maleylpyruvate isomerase family mycothiol-dependent enzyme [Glycomyces paridis]THV26165.1 maleylpyruvate isomerase family mycothiol-dependent enzyme [Glycomyces paridis]
MEPTAFRAHLVTEAALLREAALAAPAEARVPTCPEWTATDLLDHVTETYDHKIASMRLLRDPGDDHRTDRPGTAADRFDAALADLLAEFDARGPDTLAYTWYGPDQTVGFWMRRMAHETLIHRVDAELAADRPRTAIDQRLALDGIDEILTVMVDWGSRAWSAELAPRLAADAGLVVDLAAADRTWTLAVGTDTVTAGPGSHPDPAARIETDPAALLLWLWRRTDAAAVPASGDRAAAARLHALIDEFTQ